MFKKHEWLKENWINDRQIQPIKTPTISDKENHLFFKEGYTKK